MSMQVREKAYPMPGDPGQKNITGAELETIEEHFDVDGLALLSRLASKSTSGPKASGLTRNRALYAILWVTLHRADPEVTLASVFDEYAIDEFYIVDEPKATKAPKAPRVTPVAPAPVS